jgi:hypothetical protein
MNIIRILVTSVALLFIQACSHPIEIVGQGDVTSTPGNRSCLLEDFEAELDNCTSNYVIGAYNETYTATPRVGWQFDHWGNYCATAINNQCAFSLPAATVRQFWGQTVPPLQAVFAKYKLTGPILPDSGIHIAPPYLAQLGYQKKEFFLAGTARSYTPTTPLPTDGKLVVSADPEIAGGNYKTRLVVFQPVNPADFNGTVIVEWFNVTAGTDTNPDWIMAHNEFIREGYAYVGVSAQAVGVNALVNGATTAARYGSLSHPGDSYSYDIFTRVGLLANEASATILSGLTADRVIATGESQSASRMVTYINMVQPIENVFDGFMVHSRSGSGSSIRQDPLPNPVSYPSPAPIRDDLAVPVMVVQAEGDVINSNLGARQADTALFRLWEMAGTSHADTYTIVGINDSGTGSGALAMFGFMRAPTNPFACTYPMNSGSHHWIVQAAFHGLDSWVRTAVAPPTGPLLDDISSSPVVLARDPYGNALGGVRSPHVDVPVATLDSENGGPFFCRLFGRTMPFTVGDINSLYTDKADFMSQWVNAINVSVANGFMRQADAADLEAAANAWDFPN